MKLLLLLFLIPVLKVSELNQPLYSSISNDTIMGKQASYCYMKDTRITTIIRNVNNVDTSEHVYFDNGEDRRGCPSHFHAVRHESMRI